MMGLSGGCVWVWTAKSGEVMKLFLTQHGQGLGYAAQRVSLLGAEPIVASEGVVFVPLPHPVALASQPRSGTSEPISIDAEL